MFISPTEPPALREIGAVAMLPEEYGADILWQSKLGLVGIQRKEFPNDFLASVHDGRLNTQLAQMKSLDIAVLLLEGRANWTIDGQLIRNRNGKRHAWNRDSHRNYLASVQLRGVQVQYSESLVDTISFIQTFSRWTNKNSHHGLDNRPAAGGPQWGTVSNEDYVRYLYSSLPGINAILADSISQTLGMIFRLDVTEEELMSVPGIGKGRAKNIMKVFKQ
jgi:ERCC4-type nuclease